MIPACAICAGRAAAEAPAAGASPSYLALTYTTTSRAPVIPPSEAGLQTIVAEPWYSMTTSMPAFGGMGQNLFIETPLFDGQGNLLFVEVQGGRVMRLSPKQDLRMILPKNEAGSAGLAFLKDGRILVAGVGSAPQRGSIFSIRPDGSDKQAIVNPKARYVPNDIAMDGEGGFYHFAADMKTIPPIMTA